MNKLTYMLGALAVSAIACFGIANAEEVSGKSGEAGGLDVIGVSPTSPYAGLDMMLDSKPDCFAIKGKFCKIYTKLTEIKCKSHPVKKDGTPDPDKGFPTKCVRCKDGKLENRTVNCSGRVTDVTHWESIPPIQDRPINPID